MLATLVVALALVQFAFAARLSLFRRVLTPTVTGTVLMLTPVTVMPIMFEQLKNVPSGTPPPGAPLIALSTLDFRAVQGAVAADSLGNLLSGLAGTIPLGFRPTGASMVEITGISSRRIGLALGAAL